MSKRVFRYLCYAWLLKEKPVWSIVIYADNSTKWRSSVPDSFVYGFHSKNKEQHHKFDIIRIKDEKSKDLIKKHSLMCKLLALKADDKGTDRKELIGAILKSIADMEYEMNDHIKLLVLQWIDFYSNVSPEILSNIKEEVDMFSTAATITEHYLNQGIARGEKKGIAKGRKRGIAEGEKRGIIKGKIENLASLYSQGILPKTKYNEMVNPLQRELGRIS
jgi:flagellar biosynthesis/type III secretory pathway protein FliH